MRHDKTDKRRRFLVGFIAFIMIGSTFGVIFFGFASSGATSSITYNGFKLIRKGNVWTTKVNGIDALFTYTPPEIEIINASNEAINKLKNRIEIDVTSAENDTNNESIALAQYQMKVTLNNFNIFVRDGFIANNTYNLPIITCNNSTQYIPVIYFKTSNQTKISLEGNCIIAESLAPENFIKIKDRLVYGVLGIIGEDSG